ncbi:MAG: polysaccharide biosynthesis/export family protein [Phycisphaerales bacterium]|nr:polysaccharide biosynthesis/export family protein [Phycisphaerales bacterium]
MTLAGCAALPPNSFFDPTKVGAFPHDIREAGIRRVLSPREAPEGLSGAREPTPEDLVARAEEYRVGRFDQIQISVNDLLRQGAPYQSAQEVNTNGFIRIPDLGPIYVADMTEPEVEDEIRNRLIEADLLPDPIVQVVVVLRRQLFFHVLGDVVQQGTFPISQADLRLLDALAFARGAGPLSKKLYVIRRGGGKKKGATTSTPESQAPRPQKLIIEPPSEGDDDFFGGSGAVRDIAYAQDMGTSDPDFENAIAPRGNRGAGHKEPAATTPTARPFEPLMIDPATGEAREAPARPTLEAPGEAPVWNPQDDEDFDWSDLPSYELDQEVIEIDLGALRNGDPRYNIVIKDRDVIRVPVATGVFYMMGEVARPGVFAFGGREITLKQAVAIAGGFGPLAWPQRCEIIRREPGSDTQLTIPVDVDAIFAGLADDVILRDEDVVNVGTHVAAPFLFVLRNSFRFTYGFGFVYDRNFADQDQVAGKQNPETIRRQERAQRGLPF